MSWENHCRRPGKSLSLIFHENLPFGGMEITATYQRFLFCYKPWTRNVADFPRANARTRGKSASFPRGHTSPYTYSRYVRINTVVELDRPWRMSLALDS